MGTVDNKMAPFELRYDGETFVRMILNCLLVELTHSIAERLKKLCR